jgi:hypothetical protein
MNLGGKDIFICQRAMLTLGHVNLSLGLLPFGAQGLQVLHGTHQLLQLTGVVVMGLAGIVHALLQLIARGYPLS